MDLPDRSWTRTTSPSTARISIDPPIWRRWNRPAAPIACSKVLVVSTVIARSSRAPGPADAEVPLKRGAAASAVEARDRQLAGADGADGDDIVRHVRILVVVCP